MFDINEKNHNFDDLPYEIIINIVDNLEDKDILQLCMTNTKFKYICNDDILWANTSKNKFGYPINRFLKSKYGMNITGYRKYLMIKYIKNMDSFNLGDYIANSPFSVEVQLYYLQPDTIGSIKEAVEMNNYDILNLLLEDGRSDPSGGSLEYIRMYADSGSPLAIASQNGLYQIVELLLTDNRVDPTIDTVEKLYGINEFSENGIYTLLPIILASAEGHLKVVDILLNDKRTDPSEYGNLSIIRASENGHVSVIKRLLNDPRVDASDRNNDAIIGASNNGHLDAVNILIENILVDPSDRDNLAIENAKINFHRNIENRLIMDPRVRDCNISYNEDGDFFT